MATYRLDRITEEIKKELSEVIRELKDPRLAGGLVSVVKVDVTRDLRFAKAYISVLGAPGKEEDVIRALRSAAGFIRKEIGHRVDLRMTPEFSFVTDNSIEHGAHINELLHNLIPKETEE